MIEIKERNTRYNFKIIDQIFDFLMEIGVNRMWNSGLKEENMLSVVWSARCCLWISGVRSR